jgi:biopolymer transport protein ExbD
MKFRTHLQLEKGQRQIDITPLIDMVFQLLIFFLLTSNFVLQPGIRIDLPKAVTSEAVDERSLIITITEKNLLLLNDVAIGLAELKKELKGAVKKNIPLLIKADRKANLGKVVEVWDICREIGLTQVNIATNQKE